MPPALIPSASLGTGQAKVYAAKTRYVLLYFAIYPLYHYNKASGPFLYISRSHNLNIIQLSLLLEKT